MDFYVGFYQSFTLGSVVWVVNGFYAFLPFVNSKVETNTIALGWSAWLGATIFVFGSILLIWEAWNRLGSLPHLKLKHL
jgi:hypothetical protein